MGNGRGGTNHGAERPKGVGNKRRPARLRAERAGRRLRFDYMLEPLNDKTQPIERRDRMVIADAPLDPRLNTIATAKTRFKMTTMEIDHLLARELKHAFQQDDTRRIREIGTSADRHRWCRVRESAASTPALRIRCTGGQLSNSGLSSIAFGRPHL